jgi:4-hydroxy-2-oxoheptanedioate aldolase
MRANALRHLWSSGGAAINGWLSIPSAYSAELMAHQGWDSLTVDMQHGVIDYQMASVMLQGISTTAAVPLARVPWNDPAPIMKVLDAGAYGVICPMISTAAEAKGFADACRYPPRGYRSFGPNRALLYAGADYVDHANDAIVALAMIETAEGLGNLEAILDVPGVDGVYVGPADLSLALGAKPAVQPTDKNVVAAIERIAKECRRRKLMPGIHCGSPDMARRMIDQGYQFCSILNDGRILANAASGLIAAARQREAGKPQASGPY